MTNRETLPSASTVVRGPAQMLCEELDGEILIVNPESHLGYSLNGVGGRIWQLLQQPTTIATFVEQLLSEFDIDADTCNNEVREFLKQLRSADLVSIDSR